MFVVGAIAGVVGGATLANDDHSARSEYSDAAMSPQVKAAKEKEKALKEQLRQSREELDKAYQAQLDDLKAKYGDIEDNSETAEKYQKEQKAIVHDVVEHLQQEADEAQKQIRAIDEAVAAINKVQLTGKLK